MTAVRRGDIHNRPFACQPLLRLFCGAENQPSDPLPEGTFPARGSFAALRMTEVKVYFRDRHPEPCEDPRTRRQLANPRSLPNGAPLDGRLSTLAVAPP